jgi:hypothetical protein
MKYTDTQLTTIKNCGAYQYSIDKCLRVLDLPTDQEVTFIEDFDDPDSEVYRQYNKGKDQADYYLDTKLFSLAREGDMKALDKFEQRRALRVAHGEDSQA